MQSHYINFVDTKIKNYLSESNGTTTTKNLQTIAKIQRYVYKKKKFKDKRAMNSK